MGSCGLARPPPLVYVLSRWTGMEQLQFVRLHCHLLQCIHSFRLKTIYYPHIPAHFVRNGYWPVSLTATLWLMHCSALLVQASLL